ncbi:two-component system response regulator [Actimicrobium sp. CCC2.4]|uniref:two-component system response regulator n=1 Tax=Actimicrobium sp. CCC2.4 TaxID=3048606 RepID=UPI002AC92A63|nr:two-component system response regulator [Actimicrobium sp. CCC2.4]MEB0137191.1 two-component system response regulator [Actimicrobium sp. CCC2.4]WPX32488.1 two-component system response regulator [Actimicrobium sp. CCC2.4]
MSPSDKQRATILVVDDTPLNLSLLTHMLKDRYRVKVASNGAKALALAAASPPDMILLDIMMPEMDGFEVCRRLKENPVTRHIPVIFLTARTDIAAEEEGFAAGAVDFIHKPISPPIVAARVKTHLDIQSWQAFLQDRNAWLQRQVDQRLSEINHLQDAAICVMVSLAEFRDETTGNHIRRTQEYVRLLGVELARLPHYRERLTPGLIEQMSKSAPLHDIGKIAIPDHILLKPGKLTTDEFTIMKTHARCGYDMLVRAGVHMGERGHFLDVAKDIAGSHHEKWDGSGYPDGLAGQAIPLAARLMALADVFDALRSRRPYKEPMHSDQAAAIIVAGRGLHFDPEVVDAFLAIRPEFERIAAEWMDHA